LFYKIFKVQTLQHKKTRDLSSSNRGEIVEQGALMSPNPSGKLEDPADECVV